MFPRADDDGENDEEDSAEVHELVGEGGEVYSKQRAMNEVDVGRDRATPRD
jgi:hypothetical protein